ncbi:LysR family transcriptional regulator [Ottowia thiooxydans]|uniref:LysR family transcriptional regulator n=1 Tax=Ottowia thiooxydans TaxID=219182 RepID=UPI0004132D39|nr:LysR family transcriptional regulator [Ottowia thiooxydans]
MLLFIMDIRSLRYFATIAQAGSFTQAARDLHIAQPALSQHIRRLEEEIGVPLLVRHPRGVKPTAAGELLLGHARRIVFDVEYALAQARQLASEAVGTVHIGLPQSLGMRISALLFRRTRERFPNVSLAFHEAGLSNLPGMVEKGVVDLAVTYTPAAAIETSTRLVAPVSMFAVGCAGSFPVGGRGKRALAQPSITLEESFALPLVLGPRGQWHRDYLQDLALKRGLTINLVGEADSLLLMLEAARSGSAFTILTSTTADVALQERSLSGARIEGVIADRPLYVFQSLIKPASRAVMEIRALIQEELESLAVPRGG